MPKPPPSPSIQMPPTPPPPPMFGQQPPGAANRVKAQSDRAKAFSGSLMGSQLSAASTGQKTLLGATG
jgi:hypothetical protein